MGGADEDLLAQMDLDAIIAAELDKLKHPKTLLTVLMEPVVPVNADWDTKQKNNVPPLLKLHTTKPPPKTASKPAVKPRERVFLLPVSDEQVNSQKHKRYTFWVALWG